MRWLLPLHPRMTTFVDVSVYPHRFKHYTHDLCEKFLPMLRNGDGLYYTQVNNLIVTALYRPSIVEVVDTGTHVLMVCEKQVPVERLERVAKLRANVSQEFFDQDAYMGLIDSVTCPLSCFTVVDDLGDSTTVTRYEGFDYEDTADLYYKLPSKFDFDPLKFDCILFKYSYKVVEEYTGTHTLPTLVMLDRQISNNFNLMDKVSVVDACESQILESDFSEIDQIISEILLCVEVLQDTARKKKKRARR